ncbi:MAG: YfhO family protein [Actinobacteria bacterium]|nr:YfhO family protein [Actinomycetota bacterium]
MIAAFFGIVGLVWLVLGLAAWCWRRAAGWHLEILATGLYVPAILGFFWQLAFLPDVVVPKGGGDLASFLYPVFSFAAQQWQQGVVPLWNPYLYGGSPFVADMQTASFYPPNLLAFLLARPFTYETLELLAVGHYFLVAVFTYAYGRTLTLTRPAAFGFGLIFTFSGFMVAHLGHLNMLEATVWLPLALLCFHRAIRPGGWPWSLGAGLALGLSLLAGHNQISLYLAMFLFIYWLWALGMMFRKAGAIAAPERGFAWSTLLSLPLAGLLALSVAAVQLLPAAELIPLTIRASLSYPEASKFAATPASLLMLLVPHFFGSSAAAYWGIPGNLTELYGYVGILPLALALVAMLVLRRRSPWLAFYAFAALLFLLLSLGENTILHGWLYRFVPGFDKVRAAGRFVLFFDFGVALLAGFGLQALGQPLAVRARPAWRWLMRGMGISLGAAALIWVPFLYHALLVSLDKDPGVIRAVQEAQQSLDTSVMILALALALLLVWRYRPGLRAWVLPVALAVIVLDLFSANADYNPTTEDVLAGYDHPAALQFLQGEGAEYRIDTQTDVGGAWQPDLTLLNGIDDVMGMYNPMLLADYQRYWENLGSRSVPGYDLLNAKYVVGYKDIPLDKDKFEVAFTDDPRVNIYRNRNVLPRALLTAGAEVLPREQILARLKSAEFDPKRVALLEEGDALAGSGSAGEVRDIRRPSVNQVIVDVNATAPGYLVLAEVWYPGWRVYVDGVERPLRRTDYIFRSVRVEPGQHEVRFAFQPRFWPLGLWISLATLAMMALILAVALWRRPNSSLRGRR